jgi:hypothetical protein
LVSKRRLLIGLAIMLATCAALGGVAMSGANLTSASSSTISASAAGVQNLLHLYSQASDPDGTTGYYVQPGTSTLAATGTDATLAVNLGKQSNVNTNETLVFTMKAASPFPTGITSISVAASVVADPTTTLQPINAYGFAAVGNSGRNNPVTLTAGQKMQCNLRTNVARPSGTVYHPKLVITVTYSGYSGGFFVYTVPVTVTAS